MNKIFSLSVLVCLAALSFSSCVKSEEDDIFDKSAAERLNEASALYSGYLESSKGGWVMEYYATNDTVYPKDNGYIMLAKFNADGSVVAAMNNVFSGFRYIEDKSAWEVLTDNGPVLSFNSYNNVIHTFSNPEDLAITTGTGKNETGKGALGDYEFVMVDVPENLEYIMLKGKKRGSYTRMTRLPEDVDFRAYLADLDAFNNKFFPSNAPNKYFLNVGDSLYVLNHMYKGIAMTAIYPQNGNEVIDIRRQPYLVTKRDDKYYLRFRNVIIGKNDVKAQEFVYDVTSDKFVDVNNPANYIVGEDIMTLFKKSIDAGHNYNLIRGNAMSDAVAVAVDKVYSTYNKTSSKYGVTTYSMTLDKNGKMIVKCLYNPSDINTELQYSYDVELKDNILTLQNVKAVDTRSANHLARVTPVIQEIFSQSFKIERAYTQFNQSKLKFTSTTNPNVWFELVY